MLGAIAGDIIGSRFEFSKLRKNKSENFELFTDDCFFTDDTVLTIATADAILNNYDFGEAYYKWGNKYPRRGYGGNFEIWLKSESLKPYNSFGNGSAMRVSPIGWIFDDVKTVIKKAEESAVVTHNHEEGIKGAVSVALCIYFARNKIPKKIIKEIIESYFDYNLNRKIADIRPNYRFDVTCQGSVPEAIICFLESNSFKDAIKKAVSLGGDTDTQACIAGSIAEAYYGIENEDILKMLTYLNKDMSNVVEKFGKIKKRRVQEDY